MELTATTTIRRPRSEVYGFWRDLENLPTFMAHLDEVRATGDRAQPLDGDRAVRQDRRVGRRDRSRTSPGEKIAWQSDRRAPTSPTRGKVRFVPAPDGVSTEVHVVAGATTSRAARSARRSPSTSARNRTSSSTTTCAGSSRSLETGEVVRSDGAPCGKRARKEFPQRPAQPLSDAELSARRCGRMKANCWAGRNKVEVRDVPDPKILNRRDAIVRITSTAICGSDLHLLDGYVPTMQDGDIMGHEFMGEVVEVGPGVDPDEAARRRPGRRAVPHRLRRLQRLRRRAVLVLREHQPQRRASRRRCSATRSPGSSATRTSPAASPAARPSTRGCRSPTSAR